MQVTLLVRAPKKPEKRVVVENDVVIGRGKDCNLRVLSNDVSRQHCRLIIGDSEVSVRDLGSGNGTLLNGRKTEPNDDTPLISGDIVRIGPLVIKVEFPTVSLEPAGSAPAEPELDPVISSPVTSSPADAEVDSVEPATETEPAIEADGWEPDADEPAPTIETNPVAEQFLDTDEDEGLIADDGLLPDEFAEADPAQLESAESIAAEATEAESQPGKLKSLFGRFGKKKGKDEPKELAAESSDSEPASDATAQQEPLLVEEGADYEHETIVFDPGNAFTPDDESAELSTDEYAADDDEEYLDEDVDEEAEDGPVDPGFADFLNQVDDPPK